MLSANPAKSNADIDRFLVHGEFEIEPNWGQSQLADYLNELTLLDAGADWKELGIGRRRAASLPSIIEMSAAGPRIVSNPEILRETSLTRPGSYALLKLSGVMRAEDGASSRGINNLLADIRAAWENENIDGILIEANTGGGESLAGNILRGTLEESPKAVVVWAHFLASAGISGTLPADEIIGSTESAQFGSIGTFITLSKGIGQYYSNNYEEIYADKSTNKNREWRELLKGNKAPISEMVNRSNDYFLKEVERFRQLKGDKNHTLSGAMFYAKEAKQRGLSDGTGSFNYAIKRLEANVKRRKKSM